MTKRALQHEVNEMNGILKKKTKMWNLFLPSELSKRCTNPIRTIVDNIKKPSNSDKSIIPLSLGKYYLSF